MMMMMMIIMIIIIVLARRSSVVARLYPQVFMAGATAAEHCISFTENHLTEIHFIEKKIPEKSIQ